MPALCPKCLGNVGSPGVDLPQDRCECLQPEHRKALMRTHPTRTIGGFEFSLVRIPVPGSQTLKAWEIHVNGKSLGNWTPCYTKASDSAERIFEGLEDQMKRDPERFTRDFTATLAKPV